MKSAHTGINTSTTEVTDISPFGIWLLSEGREYFLSYEEYPWFRNAPVSQVFHVVLEGYGHLRWPELDVDLSLESIRSPESFPLVYDRDDDS